MCVCILTPPLLYLVSVASAQAKPVPRIKEHKIPSGMLTPPPPVSCSCLATSSTRSCQGLKRSFSSTGSPPVLYIYVYILTLPVPCSYLATSCSLSCQGSKRSLSSTGSPPVLYRERARERLTPPCILSQLPRHKLHSLVPRVKALALKHGIPYLETEFGEAMMLCGRNLASLSLELATVNPAS